MLHELGLATDLKTSPIDENIHRIISETGSFMQGVKNSEAIGQML